MINTAATRKKKIMIKMTSTKSRLALLPILLIYGACEEQQAPRPDSGPQPAFRAYVSYPAHLTSNCPTSQEIKIRVDHRDPNAAWAKIKAATTIIRRNSKAAVAGTWENGGFMTATISARFVPKSPFSDGDYVIKIKPDKELDAEESTLFHVGSMPRVESLLFSTDSSKAVIEKIYVNFSEHVNLGKFGGQLELDSAGKWSQVTFQPPGGGTGTGLMLKLTTPLKLTDKVRVTIPDSLTSTSGVKLDAAYTAKPGTGSFSVDLVPADHLHEKMYIWRPPLSL